MVGRLWIDTKRDREHYFIGRLQERTAAEKAEVIAFITKYIAKRGLIFWLHVVPTTKVQQIDAPQKYQV